MNILLAPVGSSGDVYPFLGLGQALQQRGHHVTVLSSGYFAGAIEKAKLRFVEVQTKEEFLEVTQDPLIWHPLRGPRRIMQLAITGVQRQYDAILAHRGEETVVVSSCLGWGARVAEERHKIPLVTWHLQPSVIFSARNPPRLAGMLEHGWLAPWWNRAIYTIGERFFLDPVCIPQLNAFRRKLGLPPVRGITHWWQSPKWVVGAFPAWFAPQAVDWPPHVRLSEFPLWDEDSSLAMPRQLINFLEDGSAPIVFTPGSANRFGNDFFALATEACQHVGCRGIMASRFDCKQLDRLPGSCLRVRYASFAQLLPRSAAIVHHGGIGTTARALASGIPQVIHPFSHDQPDNAARVERLRAGTGISPRKLSAKRLAVALQHVLESAEIHNSVKELQRRIQHAEPFAMMCRIVESLPFSGES